MKLISIDWTLGSLRCLLWVERLPQDSIIQIKNRAKASSIVQIFISGVCGSWNSAPGRAHIFRLLVKHE